MEGCNDEYGRSENVKDDAKKADKHSVFDTHGYPYTGANAAYHSYTGTGMSPMNIHNHHYLQWAHQPPHHGFIPFGDVPHRSVYVVPNLDTLNGYSSRVNARRLELERLLHELDREQQGFNSELNRIAATYDDSRRAIAMQYNALNSIMRSVAPIQLHNPPEGVYVNAYPLVPWNPSSPYVKGGLIQPFVPSVASQITPVSSVVTMPVTPVPQPEIVVLPSPPPAPSVVVGTLVAPTQPIMPDFALFIQALLQFIETCLSLVRLSSSGNNLETELDRIRSSVLSLRGITDSGAGGRLVSLSQEVNSLLPRINALPRKTISEVWIDPLRVSSRDERNKLDQLVIQEARSTVSVSQGGIRDEEINIQSSIPNMFTIATNARTSHHHLKVLWDVKSRQLKLVAVCHRREFQKHSDKPRWFFAFTCDDQGGSMKALTDPGRNHMAQSVLKVVCHSKEFARRLVLESVHREDRCRISKWSTIAQGLGEPKFSKLDRNGRSIWRSLVEHRGCFDRDESKLHSRCNTNP